MATSALPSPLKSPASGLVLAHSKAPAAVVSPLTGVKVPVVSDRKLHRALEPDYMRRMSEAWTASDDCDFTEAEVAWANWANGRSALDVALDVAVGILKDASGYNDIKACLGGDWGACAGLAFEACPSRARPSASSRPWTGPGTRSTAGWAS